VEPGSDSAESRRAVEAAVRGALATIAAYTSGDLDPAAACRAIVNDEHLREAAPIRLLLGFIDVESRFEAEPETGDAPEPEPSASERYEQEVALAEIRAELDAHCAALTAHLEQWRRDNPPSATV
jgi:hypothetical protein